MPCQCFILSIWKFHLTWKVWMYFLVKQIERLTYTHFYYKLSLFEFWLLPLISSEGTQISTDPTFHKTLMSLFLISNLTYKYLDAEELVRWLNSDTEIRITEIILCIHFGHHSYILFYIEIKKVHSTLLLGQCAHAQLQKLTWQVVTC